ncbi:hypothetical protein DXG01_013841 [Tephrocybe rancida]|nr:hypothetical protein DXG01_013841 [Tephrocybe rancida]
MSHGSYSSQSQSQSGSAMTEDEEDWEDYVKGGYHPVKLGDAFSEGRYVVVRKLGWGHFSTVWLARDTKMARHVALKVVKSAPRYTETALDEIKLLQRLITSSNPPQPHPAPPSPAHTHPGRSHVISFLDHFRHKGPNGTHVCMVFEVLGENLLGLIKRHQNKGVPMGLVRQIAKQVLLGLDYMHRCCGVIHTDLKPENVLICIDDVESIIQSELASSSTAPSSPSHAKLTGVPPSKGRGGNQTPRSESVFITGSQPLPSPSSMTSLSAFADRAAASNSASSSYSAGSPMMDRWAFGMSRIEAPQGGRQPAPALPEDLAGGVRNVSLTEEAAKSKSRSHEKDKDTGTPNRPATGPSLLSQQAPAHIKPIPIPIPASGGSSPAGTAMMSVDAVPGGDVNAAVSEFLSGAMRTEGEEGGQEERITVKIADLGNGGDYLFDPASGSRYSKDDDHIAQIMELMGEIPKSVAFAGKYAGEFFNRKGELRHITKLRYWPLESVLHDKYLFPVEEADALAAFLTPMLRLHPDKRARASELVCHRWLDGIVVQGEIDVIRRAEREEREGRLEVIPDVVREGRELSGSRSRERDRERKRTSSEGAALTQSEVDAMKPVDESLSPAEGSVSPSRAQQLQTPGGTGTVRLGNPPTPSASAGAKENVNARSNSGAGGGRGASGSGGGKRR